MNNFESNFVIKIFIQFQDLLVDQYIHLDPGPTQFKELHDKIDFHERFSGKKKRQIKMLIVIKKLQKSDYQENEGKL